MKMDRPRPKVPSPIMSSMAMSRSVWRPTRHMGSGMLPPRNLLDFKLDLLDLEDLDLRTEGDFSRIARGKLRVLRALIVQFLSRESWEQWSPTKPSICIVWYVNAGMKTMHLVEPREFIHTNNGRKEKREAEGITTRIKGYKL